MVLQWSRIVCYIIGPAAQVAKIYWYWAAGSKRCFTFFASVSRLLQGKY